MYVTLTDLQNGEPVYLTRPLLGGLELTYYHQFYNISAALINKQIRNGPTTIPGGYYNDCELDTFFQLLNAELTLLSPTGRSQLSTVKRLNLHVILNRGGGGGGGWRNSLVTIRVHQCDLIHTKWLMRVALGVSENALGRLWPTLVTLKGSIEAEKKTSFTLSSCLMGSTK